MSWTRAYVPYLWIVTIARDPRIPLALLLEPCTSRPFRLDEAIVNETAPRLKGG